MLRPLTIKTTSIPSISPMYSSYIGIQQVQQQQQATTSSSSSSSSFVGGRGQGEEEHEGRPTFDRSPALEDDIFTSFDFGGLGAVVGEGEAATLGSSEDGGEEVDELAGFGFGELVDVEAHPHPQSDPFSQQQLSPFSASSTPSSAAFPFPTLPFQPTASSSSSSLALPFLVDPRTIFIPPASQGTSRRPSSAGSSSDSQVGGTSSSTWNDPQAQFDEETEKGRRERRRATNRASAKAFRLRKKSLLQEQQSALEARDTELARLLEEAETLKAENEELSREPSSSSSMNEEEG